MTVVGTRTGIHELANRRTAAVEVRDSFDSHRPFVPTARDDAIVHLVSGVRGRQLLDEERDGEAAGDADRGPARTDGADHADPATSIAASAAQTPCHDRGRPRRHVRANPTESWSHPASTARARTGVGCEAGSARQEGLEPT